MKKLLLLHLFAIGLIFQSESQSHVVQVSGVVVATDSLLPVPYATIYRSIDHRGTYSDYNGYFTMPVVAGDTLHFVSIGLKKSFYIVPIDTSQPHISIVQWMDEDELLLPTVNVMPYPSPYKLRTQVLALDLPGDRYYKFDRNVAAAASYDGLQDLSAEAYSQASETLIARYTSGFKSGGNLLDPAAWSKFVNALKSGDRDK